MTAHWILITSWGPCACSQSSAVLPSHFVAKYYSLLAYTWTRLKINPLATGSVFNRHGFECRPKLTKVAGHKWKDSEPNWHTAHFRKRPHFQTQTHTSRTDVSRFWLPFERSNRRCFGKEVTRWNVQTRCPLVYQSTSTEGRV